MGNGEEHSAYHAYVAKEWDLFLANSSRESSLLDAAGGIDVNLVLDIGCGAGQEMLPFIRRGARGIGIDVSPQTGEFGRKMFESEGLADNVEFLRGDGSWLPFKSEIFDLVICRVALMYMDNKRALCEIGRVLRPSGKFVLKYHTPTYYWWKFRNGFKTRHVKSSIHAARVLYAGYLYTMSGRQHYNKLTAGGEIFQTEYTLKRELHAVGLKILGTLPDSNPQAPSVVIGKCQ